MLFDIKPISIRHRLAIFEPPVEATACRSNGLSEQRPVDAKSLQISVETTACRTNGASGQWGV